MVEEMQVNVTEQQVAGTVAIRLEVRHSYKCHTLHTLVFNLTLLSLTRSTLIQKCVAHAVKYIFFGRLFHKVNIVLPLMMLISQFSGHGNSDVGVIHAS